MVGEQECMFPEGWKRLQDDLPLGRKHDSAVFARFLGTDCKQIIVDNSNSLVNKDIDT